MVKITKFEDIESWRKARARAQLYVALDQGYLSTDAFDCLSRKAIEVSQLLSGFMKYLKGSALRGSKYG